MWRSRLLALALLAAFGAAPAAAVQAPPCESGFGVGLVEVPAGSKDPRAQSYIVDHVRPGATFSRRFQVCNGTKAPVTVQLYAGAAEVGGGTFRIVEGRATNELTSWIRIDPGTVTLQPGQRVLATAGFTVPADAEAGERYAVLLAELPPQPTANGFPVSSRVGVRVYLAVGPGGAPRSDFEVDSLQAARDDAGKGLITARVHNTGLRALDISGSLTLRDGPGGLSGGPYPARLGTTLAPGETEPVVVDIDRAVVDGPWTARLTLRSGLVERTVEAGLRFPDGPGQEAPPVDIERLGAEGNEVLTPLRLLPALAIPIVAVVVAYVVRRRRST